MSDKISILMGAYNSEKTLSKSIDSIVAQSYTNWEFLICDDASSDSTWNIILEYSKRDPRIKPLQNKLNLGLAATLNVCLSQATGTLAARQDADDTSVPERLEKQVNYMISNPYIDVLSTDAFLCDEAGVVWGERISLKNVKKSDWARGSQIIHACVLMKMDILRKVKGYDPKAIRVEDYDLWMRILAQGGKLATLPEKLYNIHWSFSDYGRKRKRDRLREIKYKLKGMWLNKMPLWSYIFVIKSFILIMVPNFILYKYHSLTMRKNKLLRISI